MRLIDGDKLQDFPIRGNRCDKERANTHFLNGIKTVLEYAEQLPTVDAEVVVHCRDCRYRGMIYCPAVHETMGNGLIDYTSDEAYCWRGRPKEYTNAT